MHTLFTVMALLASEPTTLPATDGNDVAIGVYLNDLHNLDLKTQSFSADFYVWFRWRGEFDPSQSFELMNAYEAWGHVRRSEYEAPVVLPSGEKYQVVHCQGRFAAKFKLHDYPFDKQQLTIEIEDARRSAGELRFVVDSVAAHPTLSLPGYQLSQPLGAVAALAHPSSFGDPRLPREPFSKLTVAFEISRHSTAYALKLLLPVMCVILAALMMFMFDARYVEARVGLGITALLTVVALQITLNDDLPDVDYLVLMDEIYLLAYALIVSMLLLVARSTILSERGLGEKADRLDQIALYSMSIVTVLGTIAVLKFG